MQKKGGERPSLALTTKPKRTQAHAHCGPVPTCFSRFFACVSAQSFDLSLFFFFLSFFLGLSPAYTSAFVFFLFLRLFLSWPFCASSVSEVGWKESRVCFIFAYLFTTATRVAHTGKQSLSPPQTTHTHTHCTRQPNPFSSLGFKKG